MATTKVNTGVTDLNQTGSESGLKMPTGGTFSGTPAEGMMRNDTAQSSEGSISTMQHYNGLTWKNYVNLGNYKISYLVIAGGGGGGCAAAAVGASYGCDAGGYR